MKLGGLGSFINGFPSYSAQPPASSEALAADWRAVRRDLHRRPSAPTAACSSRTIPVDSGAGSYGTIVNAYKRLTAGCSAAERTSIFSGTAIEIYRLAVDAEAVCRLTPVHTQL